MEYAPDETMTNCNNSPAGWEYGSTWGADARWPDERDAAGDGIAEAEVAGTGAVNIMRAEIAW